MVRFLSGLLNFYDDYDTAARIEPEISASFFSLSGLSKKPLITLYFFARSRSFTFSEEETINTNACCKADFSLTSNSSSS